MKRLAAVLLSRCIRLAGMLVLSGAFVVLLAPAAAAHDCDLRINPEDCQNTAWTVGTAGAIAAAAAVAAVVVASKPDPVASRSDQVDGEWVQAHVRAVASDAGGSQVVVVESGEGGSPSTTVIRIMPHADAGTQVVEEVDE